MPYTKLDAGIIFSTVWREPHTTVRVWIAMLALKDRHGEVRASIPGLADASRVSLEECEAALTTLRSPDSYSRTKEFEGRRIEDIDGGWYVLNHEKFRELENQEDKNAQAAARMKRYRKRKRTEPESVTERNALRTSVTGDAKLRVLPYPDTDADTDTEKNLTTFGFASTWEQYPQRKGGNSKSDAFKAWRTRMREGVSKQELYDGVVRYAAFCQATGKIGTEYVKQARTFFGPGGHWQEPWDIPAKRNGIGTLDVKAVAAEAERQEREGHV